MRKANFKIPNQKNLQTEQSTYKQQISDIANNSKFFDGKAKILSDLKNSSITIGNEQHAAKFSSEAAEKFVKPNMSQVDQARDMKKYLKGSNFDFGSRHQ